MATIDNGSARSGCNPHSDTKQFFGGNCNDSNSTLTQSILLLNDTQGYTVAQLDSGNLLTYISFYQQSWSGSLAMGKAQISLIFRTLTKTLISTITTSLFSCTDNWCLQSFSYQLPVGTRYIDYIMMFTKEAGTAIDSYFE